MNEMIKLSDALFIGGAFYLICLFFMFKIMKAHYKKYINIIVDVACEKRCEHCGRENQKQVE